MIGRIDGLIGPASVAGLRGGWRVINPKFIANSAYKTDAVAPTSRVAGADCGLTLLFDG